MAVDPGGDAHLVANEILEFDTDYDFCISYWRPATMETKRWDISEYKGIYSPVIYLQSQKDQYGNSLNAEADIYEVWLEK